MDESRVLVVSDGGRSALRTLELALDLAHPFSVLTIDCQFLNEIRKAIPQVLSTLRLSEIGFSAGGWMPVYLPNEDRNPSAPVLRAALLQEFRDRVTTSGFEFSGGILARNAEDSIQSAAEECGFVCMDMPELWHPHATGIKPTLNRLLRHGSRPVILCPASYQVLNRVVVAVDCSRNIDSLLLWGDEWAQRLDVPLKIISVDPHERRLRSKISILEQTTSRLGIDATCHGLLGNQDGLVDMLTASDLVLTEGTYRSWPVRVILGCPVNHLIQHAPCPIGILPENRLQTASRALVASGAIGDNS